MGLDAQLACFVPWKIKNILSFLFGGSDFLFNFLAKFGICKLNTYQPKRFKFFVHFILLCTVSKISPNFVFGGTKSLFHIFWPYLGMKLTE